MENIEIDEIEKMNSQTEKRFRLALHIGIIGTVVLWAIVWLCNWWCFAPSKSDFIEKIRFIALSGGDNSSAMLNLLDEPSWIEAGTFGDMFGCLNALFTGFAFAGLVATIILEKNNMRVAKKIIEIQEKHYQRQQKDSLKKELEEALFRHAEYMHSLLKDINEYEFMPAKLTPHIENFSKKLHDAIENEANLDAFYDDVTALRRIFNSFAEYCITYFSWVDRIFGMAALSDDEKEEYAERLWKMNPRICRVVICLSFAMAGLLKDKVMMKLYNRFSSETGVKSFYVTYGFSEFDKKALNALLEVNSITQPLYVDISKSDVIRVLNAISSSSNS